ncbi:hypothetical protein E2C01_056377 [Portunus trituberculatus]|uniref:Uncharacterized protein n=1 Tax=Portunus trituberculatus TaxID=210409 RepID=A0A5B7GX74_PORTR|nr:hypothetical protein [Portunus trituberculatus]
MLLPFSSLHSTPPPSFPESFPSPSVASRPGEEEEEEKEEKEEEVVVGDPGDSHSLSSLSPGRELDQNLQLQCTEATRGGGLALPCLSSTCHLPVYFNLSLLSWVWLSVSVFYVFLPLSVSSVHFFYFI